MTKNVNGKTWSLATGADGRKYSETADAPSSGGNSALGWIGARRDGDIITISTDGTYNFGSKTNAKPMYYWDAGVENTLNSSPLSRRSFTVTNDSSPTLVTDVKPTNAAASLRFSYDAGTTAQGEIVQKSTGGVFLTDLDGAGDHIIVAHRRRFSFDAADAYTAIGSIWNQKLMRWWSAAGSNDIVFAVGQAATEPGSPRFAPEQTDGTVYTAALTTNDGFFGLNKNNWTTEILRMQPGTVDNFDATLNWMCNGENLNATFKARTTAFPNKYRELVFPQAQHMPNDKGWFAWIDYLYIDDTPQAVLISDAPNWDTTGAYRYEPFIPVTWTTNTITASIRKGEFASLTGKYLYILGADGNPIRTAGLAL